MTNPVPGSPEEATELERRTLALARRDLLGSIARIDNRLAELEDGSEPEELDPVDNLPWLEPFDGADGRRWHVLAQTTSPANPRIISGSTQGYSRAVDLRRSVSLTLAAALRFPGSTGTLAAYLREIDPTSALAAGLGDALDYDEAIAAGLGDALDYDEAGGR